MRLTPQHRLLEADQVDVNVGSDGLDRKSLQLGGLEQNGRRAEYNLSGWVNMLQ